MATIDELRKVRVEKLKKIEQSGIPAYPASTKRTNTILETLNSFDKVFGKLKTVVLVGRIMAKREHGKMLFLNIKDGTGKIQILIKEDKVGEKGFSFFRDNFDIADFIEVKGTLFKTKRGEKTIEAEDYKMLSKALLPLPEKWHGLQDEEEKLRKRYLDIIFNPEVKDMIEKRAKFWNATREFLIKKGFLEVETPVLETTAGGADAKPFATHHNALDIDVFLRISMGELWQKRLMVAGFEKTFEIGRQFRNEGMDAEHLQDYTQMEFYWAYADHEDGMKIVEEMYKYIAQKTFGTLKFKIKGFDVDLGAKWEKYDYVSEISKHTKINVLEASLQEMEKKLQELKIEYDKNGFNRTRAMDNLWKFCRKKIGGPGFLINTPIEVSPLAKRNEKNKDTAMRFQVIIAGSENGNGYSELNNPIDQEERFKEQQKLREAGDQEAHMHDKDFVEALEHGMPPTCGFGLSERLFSFLMDKPMRECQIFPLMKQKS
jgi:lysyl-tRNA synthetase class 2